MGFWRRLAKKAHRFEQRLDSAPLLKLVLAVLFLFAGFVMLFIPGPGLLFIVLGLLAIGWIDRDDIRSALAFFVGGERAESLLSSLRPAEDADVAEELTEEEETL